MASLSQGRTAAAQCGLFTHKSVPVIFEPPCIWPAPIWKYFVPPGPKTSSGTTWTWVGPTQSRLSTAVTTKPLHLPRVFEPEILHIRNSQDQRTERSVPITFSFALSNIKKLDEHLHSVYAVARTEYRLQVLLRTRNRCKHPHKRLTRE